jgi:rhodanese-related sulfurtransferase
VAPGPAQRGRIPALARADTQIIVMCAEGYSSTLAAATLRRIGLREAADLDGGFHAWKAVGLPARPAQPPG